MTPSEPAEGVQPTREAPGTSSAGAAPSAPSERRLHPWSWLFVLLAPLRQFIGPLITKLTQLGYPERVEAIAELTPDERGRFRQWQIAQHTHWDNMHFQYQQGFLDEEYYLDSFRERVARLAPTWKALGIVPGRRSFGAEIERLLAERAPASVSAPIDGPPAQA